MERTYIIPLNKAYRAPRTKRARKAVAHVRAFLQRHMKTDAVLLGQSINENIWANSMAHPPRKIKVTVVKDNEGIVRAELFGFKVKVKASEVKKAPKKSEDKKTSAPKTEEKKEIKSKTAEKKAETKPAKVAEEEAAKKPTPVKAETKKAEPKHSTEEKPAE